MQKFNHFVPLLYFWLNFVPAKTGFVPSANQQQEKIEENCKIICLYFMLLLHFNFNQNLLFQQNIIFIFFVWIKSQVKIIHNFCVIKMAF